MNKNYPTHKDEIDFVFLIKSIWSQKLRLIIITLVSTLIGIGYAYLKPTLYSIKLKIGTSSSSEFIKFLPLNEYLDSISIYKKEDEASENIAKINAKYILSRFIEEFLDYEELTLVLKKNSHVKNKISQLTKNEQDIHIFNLAKNFKIEKLITTSDNNNDYIIKFKWHNVDEAKEILDETIFLIIENLEKNIFVDLTNMFLLSKKINKRRSILRIDYLLEQSEIARSLNIADNEIDSFNLSSLQESTTSFNINPNNNQTAYYLRGYKAIDKEIEIIQKREFKYLDAAINEINFLNDGYNNFRWIDYNLLLTSTKLLKNPTAIILVSALIGFILGIFYILSINTFVTQKSYKRKT